jgi:hypothetical protein
VRFIGCKYPYESINEGDITLRSGHEEIHKTLQEELSERLSKAGIYVEEARITELAYSAEIANVSKSLKPISVEKQDIKIITGREMRIK